MFHAELSIYLQLRCSVEENEYRAKFGEKKIYVSINLLRNQKLSLMKDQSVFLSILNAITIILKFMR